MTPYQQYQQKNVSSLLAPCLLFSKQMVQARRKGIFRKVQKDDIVIIKEVGELMAASNVLKKIKAHGKNNQIANK